MVVTIQIVHSKYGGFGKTEKERGVQRRIQKKRWGRRFKDESSSGKEMA
jgi:hypothetical protein